MQVLESKWSNYVYHDWQGGTLFGKLLEVLVFNIVADTWFYWTHRLFHTFEWM
jgi:sterol desaturase/sphingolipid hydroxylase (fatty acid hydroxylase superfamily)